MSTKLFNLIFVLLLSNCMLLVNEAVGLEKKTKQEESDKEGLTEITEYSRDDQLILRITSFIKRDTGKAWKREQTVYHDGKKVMEILEVLFKKYKI